MYRNTLDFKTETCSYRLQVNAFQHYATLCAVLRYALSYAPTGMSTKTAVDRTWKNIFRLGPTNMPLYLHMLAHAKHAGGTGWIRIGQTNELSTFPSYAITPAPGGLEIFGKWVEWIVNLAPKDLGNYNRAWGKGGPSLFTQFRRTHALEIESRTEEEVEELFDTLVFYTDGKGRGTVNQELAAGFLEELLQPDWTIYREEETVIKGRRLDIVIQQEGKPTPTYVVEWRGSSHAKPRHGLQAFASANASYRTKTKEILAAGHRLIEVEDFTDSKAKARINDVSKTVAQIVKDDDWRPSLGKMRVVV